MIVSNLDPDAQLALWANTVEMVGVHGSGMVNTMMMPSGGKHIEITGAPHINMDNGKEDFNHMVGHICQLRLAMAIGHRVRVIVSQRDKKLRPLIDLERVKKYLRDDAGVGGI